jgi:hypothetical protein
MILIRIMIEVLSFNGYNYFPSNKEDYINLNLGDMCNRYSGLKIMIFKH